MRQQPKHRPKLGGMAVSLLNELLTNTLDQGYAEAATRRAERPGTDADRPTRSAARRARALVAVGLLLAGLLGGMGYKQARRSAPESARVKMALIRDIERRTASSNALEHSLEQLAGQVVRERDAALAASVQGSSARTDLQRLESEDGLIAVRGPGLTVTIGDAPPSEQTDPVTGQKATIPPDENGRINDRDLQIVVNALWAVGAEAIAVDGRRLTATSTIREAGGAILVDFFAVTTPYTIEVIGDPDRLLPRFVDSRVGQQYQTYVGAYQILFDVRRSDDLTLAAAPGSDLRHASVLPTPAAAPASPGPSGPGSGGPGSGGPGSGGPGSGGPGSGGAPASSGPAGSPGSSGSPTSPGTGQTAAPPESPKPSTTPSSNRSGGGT
jgi:uncharacterized protein YlxW (UPF0749 family)